MNDVISQRLKDARKKKNKTQKEIAEQLGVEEKRYQKWEQGKNMPSFPDIISLANVFEVEIDYFMNGANAAVLLSQLDVVNERAPKSITYEGAEEIVAGWEAYFQDYGNAVDWGVANDDINMEWEDSNTFRIYINTTNRRLLAIRDFGMYRPNASDILFRTDYLPIFAHQPESAEVLSKRANETLDLFHAEIAQMRQSYKYPLFLVKHLSANNYLAWSLAEKKPVYVYDFKTYRDNFRISVTDIMDIADIQDNDKYNIQPPSIELIEAIKTFDNNLDPVLWSNKMRWDIWEPRQPLPIAPLHYEQYADIYTSAIELANVARTTNMGMDDDVAALERRIRQFERMDANYCPFPIIDETVRLLSQSIKTIKSSASYIIAQVIASPGEV